MALIDYINGIPTKCRRILFFATGYTKPDALRYHSIEGARPAWLSMLDDTARRFLHYQVQGEVRICSIQWR